MRRLPLCLLLALAVGGCDAGPFDADGEPYAADAVDVQATPVGGYAAISELATYPRLARDAGISGRVVVHAEVVPGETPSETRVMSTPSDLLSEAALKGVRESAWMPARIGDREVAAEIGVCLDFRLTEETDPYGSPVGEVAASACPGV